MKKQVKFKNIVNVKLFPYCKNDYEKYDLWWNNYDLNLAMNSSNNEIKRLMNIHPNMNKIQAIKLLYQPNNISYDSNNF